MPNISTLKMPLFGENFLDASDRKRIIGIVNNVITPMDPSDIRMLLTNSGTPSNVIDRINYHRGTLNVATEIVTTLEKWGGSPEYHRLGSFLKEAIVEGEVDYGAGVELVTIVFKYGLIRNREQLKDLSSRFQVPSPVFTTDDYGQLRLAPLPERLRPSNPVERLESLYNGGIKHYVGADFLLEGAKAVRSVCRVEFNSTAEATGFLVAPDLVLTNYHVLMPSWYSGTMEARAKDCALRFGAIRGEDGRIKAGALFRLHDKDWCVALSKRQELDYVLLRLQEPVPVGDIVFRAKLTSRDIRERELVNIIQHPQGGPMEVTLRYNEVVAVEGHRVYYLADTEDGSSGSPVFDDRWHVVALHRSGGERDANGNLQVEANAGVPISFILEEIKSHLSIVGS